jgi:hypothetical protein
MCSATDGRTEGLNTQARQRGSLPSLDARPGGKRVATMATAVKPWRSPAPAAPRCMLMSEKEVTSLATTPLATRGRHAASRHTIVRTTPSN